MYLQFAIYRGKFSVGLPFTLIIIYHGKFTIGFTRGFYSFPHYVCHVQHPQVCCTCYWTCNFPITLSDWSYFRTHNTIIVHTYVNSPYYIYPCHEIGLHQCEITFVFKDWWWQGSDRLARQIETITDIDKVMASKLEIVTGCLENDAGSSNLHRFDIFCFCSAITVYMKEYERIS